MNTTQKLFIAYQRAKLNLLCLLSKQAAGEAAFRLFCTPLRKPVKLSSTLFEKAEQLHFNMEELYIAGYRWNHPASKKMLIVHGFESTPLNFEIYIPLLIDKGYEVLAFHAPAHPPSSGKRITVPLYMQILERIDAVYGPFNAYLAHSLGGLTLSLYLEKINATENTRAVLIAPATESLTSMDLFFNFFGFNKRVRKAFDRVILEKGGVTADHYSVRRAMQQIRCAVLWIHDENDQLTPLADALNARADNHKNLDFVITKGLGHSRIYKDEKVIARILDFV